MRSADEVKADYITSMGNELGVSFYELYRELVEIHILWQQYRQLFGADADTVQLLNRTAGLFFKAVQDELWDSVLLGVSRMTDPGNRAQQEPNDPIAPGAHFEHRPLQRSAGPLLGGSRRGRVRARTPE